MNDRVVEPTRGTMIAFIMHVSFIIFSVCMTWSQIDPKDRVLQGCYQYTIMSLLIFMFYTHIVRDRIRRQSQR